MGHARATRLRRLMKDSASAASSSKPAPMSAKGAHVAVWTEGAAGAGVADGSACGEFAVSGVIGSVGTISAGAGVDEVRAGTFGAIGVAMALAGEVDARLRTAGEGSGWGAAEGVAAGAEVAGAGVISMRSLGLTIGASLSTGPC